MNNTDTTEPTLRQEYETYIDEIRRASSRNSDPVIPTFIMYCGLYGLSREEAMREWEKVTS